MKQVFLLSLCLLFGGTLVAQRDLTPGKRRGDVFGQSDYKDYRFYGLQLSAGPTFMLTRGNNPTYSLVDELGREVQYTNDPAGRVGAFIEVGLAHFPKKRSQLSEKINFIFISYFDWGIGYKLLGGKEQTKIDHFNAFDQYTYSDQTEGKFYNGFLFGRFSVHKNFYLGERKKIYIDNGLGFNFDLGILPRADEGSDYHNETTSFLGQNINSYHNPFVAQVHYDLGVGFKVNRRTQVIVGAQVPILGIAEWRKGCAALKWYNSNYVPLLAHVKLIYLFEKKVKGCNTPGSEDDKKRNEEFLQNN